MIESHNIPRKEWEERFGKRIIERAGPGEHLGDDHDLIKAELEGWTTEGGDWEDWTPEDAADENMSYWGD